MGAVVMDKRGWLKDPHPIAISSCYLPCICTAVNAADLYIVVADSWDDLHPIKCDRQNNYVGARCIGDERDAFHTSNSKTSVPSIAGPR